MKSFDLLRQLLTLVETFEKEKGQAGSLPEFTGFLNNHIKESHGVQTAIEPRFGAKEEKAQDIAFQIDNNIARLVIFMSRYAKSYIKKALADTPLQTPEDFTCLAILLTHENLSKGELIEINIQEKTSGTAVINRLIKAGLIKETADKQDKRGKKIAITEAGKNLLYRVFADTSNVGKIITGKLTIDEKLTLQYLLQKLENFHRPIHESKLLKTTGDMAALAKSLNS